MMYRKLLFGGLTAVAIAGAGGTALALAGTDSTDGAPVTAAVAAAQDSPAKHALLDRERGVLRRVAHGEVVVRGVDGFVTHNVIVGRVTSVSSTSITVRAADGASRTFVVTADTRVRVVGDGAHGPTSIDKIATGDRAAVVGIGTSTLTAKHVIKLLPR